jgi:hypothetical protein
MSNNQVGNGFLEVNSADLFDPTSGACLISRQPSKHGSLEISRIMPKFTPYYFAYLYPFLKPRLPDSVFNPLTSRHRQLEPRLKRICQYPR